MPTVLYERTVPLAGVGPRGGWLKVAVMHDGRHVRLTLSVRVEDSAPMTFAVPGHRVGELVAAVSRAASVLGVRR